MARNWRKKNKKKSSGGAAKAAAAQTPAPEGAGETPPSVAAPPLGTRRGLREKPEKISAKEKSALAKKAARAKWNARMTAEGR